MVRSFPAVQVMVTAMAVSLHIHRHMMVDTQATASPRCHSQAADAPDRANKLADALLRQVSFTLLLEVKNIALLECH